MRPIMKFASPVVSEYLVGQGLMGVDRVRLNKSAIIIKSSLIEEWNGKDESHKLFLILKLPVIRRMLSMLTSVSLRYFKAEWEESE